MLGLNGALVALLCVAYFVLMVCVLSAAGGAELKELGANAPLLEVPVDARLDAPVDELARRRELRARRAHPSMSPFRPTRPYHHRDAS